MKALRIETPVACQNDHPATWVMEIRGLDVRSLGVAREHACGCPKWGLGQGYSATGPARAVELEHEKT